MKPTRAASGWSSTWCTTTGGRATSPCGASTDRATARAGSTSTRTGGAGFDSQWDAGFFHPVDDTIIAADDSSRNMYAIRDAITHCYNGDATHRVIYTESHDEVANGRQRIPEMIWPGNAGSLYSQK